MATDKEQFTITDMPCSKCHRTRPVNYLASSMAEARSIAIRMERENRCEICLSGADAVGNLLLNRLSAEIPDQFIPDPSDTGKLHSLKFEKRITSLKPHEFIGSKRKSLRLEKLNTNTWGRTLHDINNPPRPWFKLGLVSAEFIGGDCWGVFTDLPSKLVIANASGIGSIVHII